MIKNLKRIWLSTKAITRKLLRKFIKGTNITASIIGSTTINVLTVIMMGIVCTFILLDSFSILFKDEKVYCPSG